VDFDAEEAVLGGTLMSRTACRLLFEDGLAPEHFYRDSDRVLFAAVRDLHQDGVGPDVVTVRDELRRRGQLEAVGGESRVHGLTGTVPDLSNLRHYGAIVKRSAYERRVRAAASRLEQSPSDADARRLLEAALGSENGSGTGSTPIEVTTLADFVAVDEPGADALVGDEDDALIPEGGDVMLYGDGGAGKTTLSIDLACHLAAGDDWLDIRVARPVRVLLIENEGPRPLFRRKLKAKIAAWSGGPVADRVVVLEQPWGRFTFANAGWREVLATTVREKEIDVVIVGPVTRAGMDEAGTLQEVRDFMALVAELRERSRRRIVVVLIHHENKGGAVSGAWEGAGDTLLHVQGQGHGRTRLYVQKARWSSAHHGTTLSLLWADGDGFTVEEPNEIDDETLAEQILAFIRENPGTSWTPAENAAAGVRRERRKAVRDALLADRKIVNVVKQAGELVVISACPARQRSRLHLAGDPTVRQLRPGAGADGAQAAPAAAGDPESVPAPCAPPLKGLRDAGADHPPPQLGELTA
jgi:hypothetical protein